MIVANNFLGTVVSANGGAWYIGMPLLLLVYVVGALELAVGLGGHDVPYGRRAAALVASIVCGAAWLVFGFVMVNTGYGCGC